LRLPDEILQTLHHLGLETIGQLRKLARESLPSRFGSVLLRRLDQLDGRLPEPLVPLAWTTPMVARFDFDGSVADPQALELTCRDLLEKLLLELERKGKGIRELRITLERADAPREQLTISASRPSRNLRSLMGLYRCAFDQLGLSSQSTINNQQKNYSRNYDVGFTAMVLEVTRSQNLAHQQVTLGDSDRVQHDDAWQNTLDLIRTRLGETSIAQVQLEHSYLPEKAFKRIAAGIPEEQDTDAELSGSRPLVLQSPPVELRVMVAPSHDADGAPLSFNFQGTLHTVKYAFGPERIAGQWWEGHNKTRDYFDVADEAGRRYWMFRVQETGKWFLHGRFE
jgi:protein ImuB